MAESSLENVARTRDDIARLHEFHHWPARKLWPMFGAMLGLSGAAVWAAANYWPLLLVIWPALGAVLFVFVVAFHDASHARLHPVRWVNELFGHLTGSLGFTPLEVYRFAHARHHAHLGTPKDPELWPFNTPGTPRLLRVLAAFCEIVLGIVYTPLLFLRAVLVGGMSARERRRVVTGYLICIAFWSITFAAVHLLGMWSTFLVAAIVPMAISATLQTLNKFTQHIGLYGHTVIGLTRTVVDEMPAAEMVSSAMMYNDYHATHHRYAKIPYYNLPSATPYTLAGATEYAPVFPTLAHAFVDMLPCLADPKVGPAWVAQTDAETHQQRSRSMHASARGKALAG